MGKIISLLLCAVVLGFSSNAHAILKCGTGIKMDVRNLPYSILPSVANQDVGITDDIDVRNGVLSAVAGAYRATHPGSLPPGAMFKVIYKDGSRECGAVASTTGSLGAVAVPNTAVNGPNGVLEVEKTNIYIQQFLRPSMTVAGWYQVCYDYYSNGELTESECHIEPF